VCALSALKVFDPAICKRAIKHMKLKRTANALCLNIQVQPIQITRFC
jgi:hypothetical protein